MSSFPFVRAAAFTDLIPNNTIRVSVDPIGRCSWLRLIPSNAAAR